MKSATSNARLRLVLEFEQEARDLATLPWEFLYYPDTDREQGFSIAAESKLILSRHVPLSAAFSNLSPSEKPLRILIAVSQPKDQKKINTDEVLESIWKLKESAPGSITIDMKYHPDRPSFSKTLDIYRPHVLHFIGHGKWDDNNKTGELAFENSADQKTDWVKDTDFSQFFRDYQPRLIFLDACEKAASGSYEGFRGIALQLVYSKVPAVVAMQYPITNLAAGKFAKKFYECLGEGKPVDIAVQESRNELKGYLQDSQDELFSSRDFGSPVAFLQSAAGIVVAKIEEVIAQKISCPNPDCTGTVRSFDTICLKCEHELGKCPNGHIIDKRIGKCAMCQWSEKEGTAVPSIAGEPVRKPEPSAAFEPVKAAAQPRQ